MLTARPSIQGFILDQMARAMATTKKSDAADREKRAHLQDQGQDEEDPDQEEGAEADRNVDGNAGQAIVGGDSCRRRDRGDSCSRRIDVRRSGGGWRIDGRRGGEVRGGWWVCGAWIAGGVVARCAHAVAVLLRRLRQG